MSDKLILNDVMVLGQALAESKYFSDAKEASQAVVKILAGQELGIGPIAAMSGLYIVKGKVVLSGNIMASLIKASQKYDYQIQEHSSEICLIEFFESTESVGVSEFTMNDAKIAGLASKDNWKAFPKNMLFNRALSNGAKWFCPDLFNGQSAYIPDEIEPDIVIEQAQENVPELFLPTTQTVETETKVMIKSMIQSHNLVDKPPVEIVNFINERIKESEADQFQAVTVKDVIDVLNDG